MAPTVDLPAAGYRYVPGVFQYSAGVAALPGYRIERARFSRPLPLAEGWRRIAAHLAALGRPLAAFCACELRSPAPFTEAGFRAFNQGYAGVLAEWGILADGRNPVARSNVCPALDPPPTPAFHAFAFTVPEPGAEPGAAPSFVVAGSGEAEEGHATYRDHIVALGDTSPAGLARKVAFVAGEMERRMAALGTAWAEASGVQVYTVHDVHPLLANALVARGAARHGLAWHWCRPPVEGLEFEMDCRGLPLERVLPA